MKFTKACPADVPQLRSLWKEAFGDSDAFLDLFFSTLFPTCDTFCAKDGDAVAGMLFALPQTLTNGESIQKAAYLYAVATRKTCQNQGVCSKLLAFAVKKLRSKGVFCIYLACHTPQLAAFYRNRGFSGAELPKTAGSLPKPRGDDAVVSAADYAGLRETLLYDVPHIRYPKAVFDMLQNAVFYRLQAGGAFGCACTVKEGDAERLLERLPEGLSQPPQFMVYGEHTPFYAAFALD